VKIIGVDNLNRDNVSDMLVAENITNEYLGNRIVEFLNYGRTLTKDEKENPFANLPSTFSNTHYKLVSDDYRLYKFEY